MFGESGRAGAKRAKEGFPEQAPPHCTLDCEGRGAGALGRADHRCFGLWLRLTLVSNQPGVFLPGQVGTAASLVQNQRPTAAALVPEYRQTRLIQQPEPRPFRRLHKKQGGVLRDPALGASARGRAGDEGAGAAERLRPELLNDDVCTETHYASWLLFGDYKWGLVVGSM